MISVSRMAGTSVRVVVPSASRAAAISFRTLFFAPVTVTSPARRAPPTTRNLSTGRIVGCRHGQPHAHLHPHRDDGSTGFGGRGRISKNDPRLVAYADCDEANSALGVALATSEMDSDVAEVLVRVQNDL